MGSQRRSRRLMGLTPDIPEFYSCDDREKLLYIESNLRRVLRLRALLDAALAAAHVAPAAGGTSKQLLPRPVQNLVGQEGSSRTTDSRSLESLIDLQGGEPRLEEAITAASGPSSSSYGANESELGSGGPIRRPRAGKRVLSRSPRASTPSEGRPPRYRGKRRSMVAILEDNNDQTA